MNDIRDLVPKDKFDFERADAAVAAGYPAVAPILAPLLEWIQDMNWPIARTIAPFLTTIGKPLAPHIRAAFATDDTIWKEWIVIEILSESPVLAAEFRADLERLSLLPPKNQDERELQKTVRSFLEKTRPDSI